MNDIVTRQSQLARTGAAAGRTAIFLHIGKTAGTTLNAILDHQYPPPRIFTVDSSQSDSPTAQLAARPGEALSHLRLVRGHMLYGTHESLPGPALYFSFLRDPVARLLSAYAHVRRTPSHRLHREVVEGDLSFTEYVTGGITLETDNWQARCIAGDEHTPFGMCNERMVDRALDNIARHFALVGVSERFDASLIVLARMYRWSNVFYTSLNRRDAIAPRLSSKELLAIEQYVALDRSLYARAAATFAAVLQELSGRRRALIALSCRNAAYTAFRHGREAMRVGNPL